MKKDILRCNFSGYYDENGGWWKWNEYCDECGELIMSDDFVHSIEPDTTEKDYCSKCYFYCK